MFTYIRDLAKKNLILRKIVGYHLASSGLFDFLFIGYKVSDGWHKRISDVLNCPDNALIPRVQNAGRIARGKQTMHNGIKIHLGSYYGPEYSKMLLLNGGVHEPQEERVFMEVLRNLPQDSVMIEMGAFWSFYSMWFQKELKHAVNFMIEPDEFNMGQGKRNFRLNNFKGTFIKAFVGKEASTSAHSRTTTVDDLVNEYNLSFIHVLHSDIQGYEYDMLLGARKTFAQKKIGYIFISTHSNDVHGRCLDFLKSEGFLIVANADKDATYSEDGLIVGKAPYFEGVKKITISKKVSENLQ